MTAASEVLVIVLVPLLLVRLIALPRVREHAVTLGWLAGCLLQLPYVLQRPRRRQGLPSGSAGNVSPG